MACLSEPPPVHLGLGCARAGRCVPTCTVLLRTCQTKAKRKVACLGRAVMLRMGCRYKSWGIWPSVVPQFDNTPPLNPTFSAAFERTRTHHSNHTPLLTPSTPHHNASSSCHLPCSGKPNFMYKHLFRVAHQHPPSSQSSSSALSKLVLPTSSTSR